MIDEIRSLDVVAVTMDIPEHNLLRGEIGSVVACYPNNAYEVEFVAEDGYTYALLTLQDHHPSVTPEARTLRHDCRFNRLIIPAERLDFGHRYTEFETSIF